MSKKKARADPRDPRRFTLVCETSSDDDLQYAVLRLDRRRVAKLRALQRLLAACEAVAATDPDPDGPVLARLVLSDLADWIEYGPKLYAFEGVEPNDWLWLRAPAGRRRVLTRTAPLGRAEVVVGGGGLTFFATHETADDEAETPFLSWGDLASLAAGVCPFAAATEAC